MKVSPMPSTGIPTATPAVSAGAEGSSHPVSTRTMTFRTNYTPGAPDLKDQQEIEQAKPSEDATQALSPHAIRLAKERRALQLQRQAFEKEKAEWQAKQGQPAEAIPKAELQKNWLKILLESGKPWDELTQDVLAFQQGNGIQSVDLDKRMKTLEESFEKKLADRETQAEQQALAEMRRHAQSLMAQGDEYSLVRETRSLPKVMELIERTHRQSGELLDVPEALKLVEDKLLSMLEAQAKLPKVQQRFQPQAPAQPQRRMTLTNRDTASQPLDRRARALAAFTNQLQRGA